MSEPDTQDPRTAEFALWLTRQGLSGRSQEDLLRDYCRRLSDAGVPLERFHVAQRAVHPKYGGIAFNWTHADGISREQFAHSAAPPDAWLKSPFYAMLESGELEFFSQMNGQDMARFPLLKDLAGRGMTEYFASALLFGDEGFNPVDAEDPGEGMLISWSTDRAGGFCPDDKALLRETLPPLGLALKSAANRQMASDLMRVYLGRDAGKRVLKGEIQRGSSRAIDAVICLFDLKGFTSLAEQLPGTELIDMLNDYFGIAVETIQGHGGNILKFMGDGILTMFDLGTIEADAKAALNAASELQAKIRARNIERASEGLPVADFTLALHAGEILYGNIGAENRLDFTVIGPTVNLTARISGMHASVGQSIILSEEVRRAANGGTGHDLVSVGRYMLRGVAAPVELFTIYEKAA
jgi:adenylate cyclase